MVRARPGPGRRRGATGKKIHDMNILATALAAGVENLVTGNVQDFPADAGVRILPLGELTMPGVDVG